MRPYKQYVAHGIRMVAVATLIVPGAVIVKVAEDWAKGRPWKDILLGNLVDLGDSFMDSLDDITDVSYMNHAGRKSTT